MSQFKELAWKGYQFLQIKIPILEWLPRYQWSFLRDDLIAGVTLSAVIIPQSLAYSALAGLPPVYGLYVALIPPFVYTFLGTSPYSSIGELEELF